MRERDCEREVRASRRPRTVTLARQLLSRSSPRIFEEKRDCSESMHLKIKTMINSLKLYILLAVEIVLSLNGDCLK